ncbi:hypothetical protein [Actinophytocola oryzae]|uniref:Uncharacterized protein n=1 Tax=Actinophytocola oryzae TaxID=502181 RepID=A0A4R7VSQ9_9PSEU|nr:hypothetical protein [Actinophytocola oryzae]TDV52419.1 hypothetical protein CLV71_105551 [Actinophytocola oryzae]
MSDTTNLLTELGELRRRTRGDRHGYAFPLFLFGTLVLIAPLCYVTASLPAGVEVVRWDRGSFPQFTSSGLLRYPDLVGWYWILTVVGGLWATTWWYRHRARRHGVESDIRVATAAAIAALLGFLVWQPLFSTLLHELFDDYMGGYSTPAVNLPILFGCAAIAAVAGVWSTRRTGWARTAGVAVATFLATVSFGALGTYLIRGYGALVIVAAALLLLAWAERSTLLTVAGGVFAGVALLTNLYDMENLYSGLGWYAGVNHQVMALQCLLLPGVVLLAGGVVAVAVRKGR